MKTIDRFNANTGRGAVQFAISGFKRGWKLHSEQRSPHSVMPNSMVTAVAVIETLVSIVMLSDPDNAQRADDLSKAISKYLFDPDRRG